MICVCTKLTRLLEHLRVARLAEMNQVEDVATVFIPRCRFKLAVTLVSVQQDIIPRALKNLDMINRLMIGSSEVYTVVAMYSYLCPPGVAKVRLCVLATCISLVFDNFPPV